MGQQDHSRRAATNVLAVASRLMIDAVRRGATAYSPHIARMQLTSSLSAGHSRHQAAGQFAAAR